MSQGYSGLPSYYVQSANPITPNLGLSLKGCDPVVAEDFVLIDAAIGGTPLAVLLNPSGVQSITNYPLDVANGVTAEWFASDVNINPANAGIIRLANNESMQWRNNANTANLALGVNSSNQLTFAGSPLSGSMVYPGAGIPNSTGSAWGTSYTTTGSGTVVALATSPTFVTPALGTPASGNLVNCTFPTLNQNTTGSAASLSISGQSGLLTFTGLTSTNRVKTVGDTADTILELGGSYTPTGTWTSLTMVTPVLGTPASGNLANCTFPTLNQNTTGSAGSVAAANVTVGTMASGMTLVAPVLGTPASGNLANCTFPTLNQNTTGSAASLSISGQSGLLTFTGLASTNRIKTVRDAADTILELGGSYTPTGTWTSLTMVTPVLGTPASGNLANCTFPTLNQNTTGSAASLSVTGQTGLFTIVGLTSTNRAKTVRDAADTLLELGGSYTPTGTWTSLTMVTPVLGTPTSGALTNCTSIPAGQLTGTVPVARDRNGIHNFNSSSLVLGGAAGTYYYITNSDLDMPASYTTAIGAGTVMRWKIKMSKTNAGTGAFNIRGYYGTAGTTSDTTLFTQSVGTATAALDDLDLEIMLSFTSTTAAYWTISTLHSALTGAGFGCAIGSQLLSGTLSGLTTTTASLKFGIGYSNTTGTAVITTGLVDARAFGVN